MSYKFKEKLMDLKIKNEREEGNVRLDELNEFVSVVEMLPKKLQHEFEKFIKDILNFSFTYKYSF